jgi:ferric-dicitrate binding protein FerR (iron transport regulator)
MKKIDEYLQHAAECREMARTASPAHRQQLEQMAETWDQLARARRHQLEKRGVSDRVKDQSPLAISMAARCK